MDLRDDIYILKIIKSIYQLQVNTDTYIKYRLSKESKNNQDSINVYILLMKLYSKITK